MMLGDYVAEKIIFGEERVTAGAESDIKKATDFLGTMFKNAGMGSIQGYFCSKGILSEYLLHNCDFMEDEIWVAVRKALQMVETTLHKEMKLLLHIANYLSDNRMLKKEDIMTMIQLYGSQNPCWQIRGGKEKTSTTVTT